MGVRRAKVVGSGWDSLPHRASHSLPGALTAVQLFLEISKEQAVMEFLCFYIWLDIPFSDFQEKAWKGQRGNLPVPALYPNRRNAMGKSCQG